MNCINTTKYCDFNLVQTQNTHYFQIQFENSAYQKKEATLVLGGLREITYRNATEGYGKHNHDQHGHRNQSMKAQQQPLRPLPKQET